MKPPIETACYRHGDPPRPAASVEDITSQTGDGTPYRKMGDRMAAYRVWRACICCAECRRWMQKSGMISYARRDAPR